MHIITCKERGIEVMRGRKIKKVNEGVMDRNPETGNG